MNTRITRALSTSCLLAMACSYLASCSSRATDCRWNETCVTSAIEAGGDGGADSGTAGKSSSGGAAQTTGGSTDIGTGGTTASSGGSSSSSATTAPPACSGLPDDACSITEEFGVFVSPLGDDLSAGTQASPVATLKRALTVAAATQTTKRRSVFVCSSAGAFTQNDTLYLDTAVDGVSIYGGFDCNDKATWVYQGATHPSNIVSRALIATKLTGLTGEIRIENLSIKSADANSQKEPGASSIAMLVVDSPNVTLKNVELIAGTGAKGQDGEGFTSQSATVGINGTDGTIACSTGIGAPASATQCADGSPPSIGGKGGDAGITTNPFGTGGVAGGSSSGGNGEIGQVAPPQPSEDGAGGVGEISKLCEAGRAGLMGAAGAAVNGGKGPGTLTSNGFSPSNGETGNPGKPGQGGGGGGGAKAPIACNNNLATASVPTFGASGASGGTGGCGGKGGGPGQGGGASIALALLNSPVKVESCTLTAARGGIGGKGGAAQSGGAGGDGGNGADGHGSMSNPSCDGGKGGRGGSGSPGGGGAGGPSLSIGYLGAAPTVKDGRLNFSNEPAPGGADGNGSGVIPTAGVQGKTVDILNLGATAAVLG